MRVDFKEEIPTLSFLSEFPFPPLIVGVTGHRCFWAGERGRIQRETTDFFVKLCTFWRERYPEKNVPIFVLNGMAEGADQLVAETVRELRRLSEYDFLRLIAVTPMPMRFYREDFENVETLNDFETAMTWAEAVIELPLTEANQEMYETQLRIKRRPQYAKLGAFLAENSQILLALWDGMDLETAPAGGTGNVVRLKLENCRSESEGGVFQVATPRERDSFTDWKVACKNKRVTTNGFLHAESLSQIIPRLAKEMNEKI